MSNSEKNDFLGSDVEEKDLEQTPTNPDEPLESENAKVDFGEDETVESKDTKADSQEDEIVKAAMKLGNKGEDSKEVQNVSMSKRMAQFGITRVILILFLILLLVAAGVVGMNVPSFFGDMLTRWGMWGILIVAMVPAIRCGIGPNFGISIGIVGGLLGAVISLELRYRGAYEFAPDQRAAGLIGITVAIVIGVTVATILGVIYGMLLNQVKGSEMAISVYVGFSAIALFNIVWALIPVTSSVLILPGSGEGIRQMLNLRDDYGGVINNLGRFQVEILDFGRVNVNTGLLILFFLVCFCMYIFTRSRTGMRMSSAGANPAYATASGINVNKMRILGTTISTALGAFGIIIYGQSFGFVQMYNAPLMMPFTIVASILIGGASIRRATVFDVLLGGFVFSGVLAVGLPLANQLIPGIPGVPEMLRMIITYGIVLFALTRAKGGR